MNGFLEELWWQKWLDVRPASEIINCRVNEGFMVVPGELEGIVRNEKVMRRENAEEKVEA